MANESWLERVIATNRDQPDLHYIEDVLVSTGWNKNDDVFLPEDTWAARATPEDKPLNLEHDELDIIGHMTEPRVVDDEGKDLTSSKSDELPSKFHVLTKSVIYRLWQDKKRQERMDGIIAGIDKGEWYVSMECKFHKFDYVLRDKKTGEEKIVARNEKTSFLDKHLRAKGGSGEYDRYKLGRAPREFFFSGKGLVRKPANPESVILSSSRAAATQSATTAESTDKRKDMSIELETTLKAAEAAAKAAEAKATEAVAKADELAKKLADSEAKLGEALTKNTVLAAEKDALLTEKENLSQTVATLQGEKRKAERTVLAKTKLGLEDAKAGDLVEGCEHLSDEAFASHLSILEEVVAAVKRPSQSTSQPAPNAPGSKSVKTIPVGGAAPPASATPVQVAGAALATTTVALADLKEEKSPSLIVATDSGVDKVQKDVVAYLGL